MARIEKEKVFFLASFAIIGLNAYFLISDPYKRTSLPTGQSIDRDQLESTPPPLSAAAPESDPGWRTAARDVFSEPRDWGPLPPALLHPPILDEPAFVPPLPRPSITGDARGRYRQSLVVTPFELGEDTSVGAGEADAEGGEVPASSSDDIGGETPEAGFRRRFDWLEVIGQTRPIYGIIENENKYDLLVDASGGVQFRHIDPISNRTIARGLFSADRFKDHGIHLADNAINRVELALRQIPEREWSPGSVPGLLRIVTEVLEEGKKTSYAYERAAEELQKYAQLDPREVRIYELQADCYAALLRYEDEIRALQAAAELGLRSGGLLQRRIRWLWRFGARERALELIARELPDFQAHRELLIEASRCLLEAGRHAEAQRRIEDAVQASSGREKRVEAIRLLGEALLSQGEVERALGEAERILKIGADEPAGLQLQAAALHAQGKYEEAERGYRALLQVAVDPRTEAEGLLGLGLTNVQRGSFDKARALLVQVARVHPLMRGAALAAQAYLHERVGDLATALQLAQEAVLARPDDDHGRYYFGRLLRRSGDYEEAYNELRAALALGASFSDLFNELGYLHIVRGESESAVRYFEESLAREDRLDTRILLGHAHFVGGDLRAARRVFQNAKAVQLSADSVLGIAYCDYLLGESASAQAGYSMAVNELQNIDAVRREYAQRSLEAILDVESKQQWEDSFLRHVVEGNGWKLSQPYGVEVRAVNGALVKGTQRLGSGIDQWTYFDRDLEQLVFFEMEVQVQIEAGHQGRAGIGLVNWQRDSVTGDAKARVALLLAVDADGTLRYQKRENFDDPGAVWKAAGEVNLRAGQPLLLKIRRLERESPKFQLLVDGAPLGEPIEMERWRGSRKQSLAAACFAAAESGKKVDATFIRVRVTEYIER